MKKIINPFVYSLNHDYKCFGCSPLNESGLKMEFWDCGDKIISEWKPQLHHEGYSKILHGGIQATIMDEIASWTVYTKCKTAGVTSKLDIRYRNPAIIDEQGFVISAHLEGIQKRIAIIRTKIENAQGVICSEATVTYFLFSEKDAHEKFHYPGVHAFYEPVNK